MKTRYFHFLRRDRRWLACWGVTTWQCECSLAGLTASHQSRPHLLAAVRDFAWESSEEMKLAVLVLIYCKQQRQQTLEPGQYCVSFGTAHW